MLTPLLFAMIAVLLTTGALRAEPCPVRRMPSPAGRRDGARGRR